MMRENEGSRAEGKPSGFTPQKRALSLPGEGDLNTGFRSVN